MSFCVTEILQNSQTKGELNQRVSPLDELLVGPIKGFKVAGKWTYLPNQGPNIQTHIPLESSWWEESNEIHIRGSQMMIGKKWIFGSLISPFCNSYPESKHLFDQQTHPQINDDPLYGTWLDSLDPEESNHTLGHVISPFSQTIRHQTHLIWVSIWVLVPWIIYEF